MTWNSIYYRPQSAAYLMEWDWEQVAAFVVFCQSVCEVAQVWSCGLSLKIWVVICQECSPGWTESWTVKKYLVKSSFAWKTWNFGCQVSSFVLTKGVQCIAFIILHKYTKQQAVFRYWRAVGRWRWCTRGDAVDEAPPPLSVCTQAPVNYDPGS